MSGGLVASTSRAEPMLSAVTDFRGSWVDLDTGTTVSRDDFARGWSALSQLLRSQGLSPADRVLLCVANGPLFPAALAAIVDNGGSPILMHGESPPAELERMARRHGARFLLADGHRRDELQSTLSGTPFELGVDLPWATGLWGRWPENTDWQPLTPEALAGVPLHPTSGTTGEPRLAARPAACALAEADHYQRAVGVDASDVILALTPMSHAYAYGGCVMTALRSHARVLSMKKFRPKVVFRALEEYRITLMPAVPVMLEMLAFGAGDRLRRPELRVLSAGTLLPSRTAQHFQELSGGPVRVLYGTTETGAISVIPANDVATDPGLHAGHVGLPMPEVAVQVRCETADASWDRGVGRVFVRSTSMMAGYATPKGLDTSAIEPGGWFATGDLGVYDGRGLLSLKGRETDVINVFGMKVVPAEVEEVIRALPSVLEVAVYARVKADSQHVCAAIVPAPGFLLDRAAVRAHCQEQLIYYKRPDSIVFMDALPKTPSGKVLRHQLPQV